MDIKVIRQLVQAKRYQVKFHAVQHALKEGFGEQEMVEAILSGQIIEEYPDRRRVLICGQTAIEGTSIYLHVVCEQTYSDQIALITAYIPDERAWQKPPFKRKRTRK